MSLQLQPSPPIVAPLGRWFSRFLVEVSGEVGEASRPGPMAVEVASLEDALQDLDRVLPRSPEDVRAGEAAERKERRSERREANWRALGSEILALHGELGTGVEESHLEQLAHALRAHGTSPEPAERRALAERIAGNVQLRLYCGSGERARGRLGELMAFAAAPTQYASCIVLPPPLGAG